MLMYSSTARLLPRGLLRKVYQLTAICPWALAATAGVKLAAPFGPSEIRRGALQPPLPSADTVISACTAPGVNRWSCQTTYRWPVVGSIAAEGRPSPVREFGTGAMMTSATLAAGLQLLPPSVE